MALFKSGVPVSHAGVTVNQLTQYKDLESEVDKLNSVIISFIYYPTWKKGIVFTRVCVRLGGFLQMINL